MNFCHELRIPALVLTSFSLLGCLADAEPLEEETSQNEESPLFTSNALTANSLTQNSLTQNSLTQNSLTQNSLTQNSLTASSLLMSALADPKSRDVLHYIVGCALPSGQHIDLTIEGVDYRFDGQLGLYEQWGVAGNTCDESCQTGISSCVIARLNYLGQPVNLSVRGEGGALVASVPERIAYPHREGVYFGNIFAQPQVLLACLPEGTTSLPRVCGPSLTDCAVRVLPTCHCPSERADGAKAGCFWTRHFRHQEEQVTVYLQ